MTRRYVRVYADPVDHRSPAWVRRVKDGQIYATDKLVDAGLFTSAEVREIKRIVADFVREEPAFIKVYTP